MYLYLPLIKMITVMLFVLFQVVKSERIVVIGGGPVGLELAGELATDYPNKKITVIHNREQILDDRMASKFVKKISDGLRALKIETVLGERVDMDDLNVSQNNNNILNSCFYSFIKFQSMVYV